MPNEPTLEQWLDRCPQGADAHSEYQDLIAERNVYRKMAVRLKLLSVALFILWIARI